MKFKSNQLTDLYRRLKTFIDSNYPNAIIVEKDGNIFVGRNRDTYRVAIIPDIDHELLDVHFTKDISKNVDVNKTKSYYVSTLDELNLVKSGIQAVMDMIMPAVVNNGEETDRNDYFSEDKAYLANMDGDVIAVVNPSQIAEYAIISVVGEKQENKKESRMNKYFKR